MTDNLPGDGFMQKNNVLLWHSRCKELSPKVGVPGDDQCRAQHLIVLLYQASGKSVRPVTDGARPISGP
ncbi:MAG TPA: hypothetical protein VF799_06715, partial [Geobacteraceae bacterium]